MSDSFRIRSKRTLGSVRCAADKPPETLTSEYSRLCHRQSRRAGASGVGRLVGVRVAMKWAAMGPDICVLLRLKEEPADSCSEVTSPLSSGEQCTLSLHRARKGKCSVCVCDRYDGRVFDNLLIHTSTPKLVSCESLNQRGSIYFPLLATQVG